MKFLELRKVPSTTNTLGFPLSLKNSHIFFWNSAKSSVRISKGYLPLSVGVLDNAGFIGLVSWHPRHDLT